MPGAVFALKKKGGEKVLENAHSHSSLFSLEEGRKEV